MICEILWVNVKYGYDIFIVFPRMCINKYVVNPNFTVKCTCLLHLYLCSYTKSNISTNGGTVITAKQINSSIKVMLRDL